MVIKVPYTSKSTVSDIYKIRWQEVLGIAARPVRKFSPQHVELEEVILGGYHK
jgi:hypothetical protein